MKFDFTSAVNTYIPLSVEYNGEEKEQGLLGIQIRYEMNALNCKPIEFRHLIGKIGEFIYAMKQVDPCHDNE